MHDAFVSCQAYATRYLSCSQSPAMFVTRGPITPPTPTAPSVLRSLPPITIHQNRQRVVGSVGHFLNGSRGSVDVFEIYNSDTPQEGVNPLYPISIHYRSLISHYVVPQIGRTSLILAPLYIKRAVDTAVSVRIMLIKDVMEIDHEILMQYLTGRPN